MCLLVGKACADFPSRAKSGAGADDRARDVRSGAGVRVLKPRRIGPCWASLVPRYHVAWMRDGRGSRADRVDVRLTGDQLCPAPTLHALLHRSSTVHFPVAPGACLASLLSHY